MLFCFPVIPAAGNVHSKIEEEHVKQRYRGIKAMIMSGVFCALAGSAIAAEKPLTPLLHASRPPALYATVSIADQEMHVFIGGKLTYVWQVSTASSEKKDCTVGGIAGAPAVTCETPTGTFGVVRLVRMDHASAKWNYAPMPFTIYFDNEGDAFHGTDGTERELSLLGQEDSHGCVRLTPEHAEILFNSVSEHRLKNSYPGVTFKIQRASFGTEQVGTKI